MSLAGDYGNSPNQEWNIVPVSGDGQIARLVNVATGLCANVTTQGNYYILIGFPCQKTPQSNESYRLTFTGNSTVQMFPVTPFGDVKELGDQIIIDPQTDDLHGASWILAQGE